MRQFADLTDFTGIGYKLAEKIQHHFFKQEKRHLGDFEIINRIRHDPYKLVEVRGIGFKRADLIAREDIGIPENHEGRHFYGNREVLRLKGGVIKPQEYEFERAKIGLHDKQLKDVGVANESGLVWLPEELEAEKYLAAWFDLQPTLPNSPQESEIADVRLNNEQKQAVRLALSGLPLMALTGGAGTGKTFTLASIAREAARLGKSTGVLAFAGKAADRAKELLRENDADFVPCSTIHRALKLPRQEGEEQPVLTFDVVVLEESSMVPNWLLAEVVKALKKGATLVMVGDPHQLPPIGWGTPFEDFLAAGMPRSHLTQNYRQAGQESIFKLGEAIKNRDPNLYEAGQGVGLHFKACGNGMLLLECIDETLPLLESQTITYTNAVREQLNTAIQGHFNPDGECIFTYPCFSLGKKDGAWPRAEVRLGDKVVITENDYVNNVFNGQTGIVTRFARNDDREPCIEIHFGYGKKLLPIIDAEDIVRLGWALTVHKAQGSGWKAVTVYQPFSVRHQPTRFFYTAVSRAEMALNIITDMDAESFWRNALEPYVKPRSTLLERLSGRFGD